MRRRLGDIGHGTPGGASGRIPSGRGRALEQGNENEIRTLVAELSPLIPKDKAYDTSALERDVRTALDLLRAGKLKRGDGAELTESEMRDEIRRSFSSLGTYDSAARDRVADRVIAWAAEKRASVVGPKKEAAEKEAERLADEPGKGVANAVDRVREAMTGDAHKQIDTFAKQQVGLDAQRQKDLANVMKRIYDKATDSAARRELKNTFGADMALSATEFIDQLRQQLVMELLNRVSVLERENKELGDRITRLEKLVGSGNGKNPDISLDADTAGRGGINIRFGDIGRFDNVANNGGGIPQQVGRGGYEQSYAGMPPANPGYQWQQIPIPGYMPPQGPAPRAEAAPAQTAAEQKAAADKALMDELKKLQDQGKIEKDTTIPEGTTPRGERVLEAVRQFDSASAMQAALANKLFRNPDGTAMFNTTNVDTTVKQWAKMGRFKRLAMSTAIAAATIGGVYLTAGLAIPALGLAGAPLLSWTGAAAVGTHVVGGIFGRWFGRRAVDYVAQKDGIGGLRRRDMAASAQAVENDWNRIDKKNQKMKARYDARVQKKVDLARKLGGDVRLANVPPFEPKYMTESEMDLAITRGQTRTRRNDWMLTLAGGVGAGAYAHRGEILQWILNHALDGSTTPAAPTALPSAAPNVPTPGSYNLQPSYPSAPQPDFVAPTEAATPAPAATVSPSAETPAVTTVQESPSYGTGRLTDSGVRLTRIPIPIDPAYAVHATPPVPVVAEIASVPDTVAEKFYNFLSHVTCKEGTWGAVKQVLVDPSFNILQGLSTTDQNWVIAQFDRIVDIGGQTPAANMDLMKAVFNATDPNEVINKTADMTQFFNSDQAAEAANRIIDKFPQLAGKFDLLLRIAAKQS